MSALADALVAAQSRAVAALGNQYASGTMDEEALRAALTEIGQNDPADTSQWIAALDIIRATGAARLTDSERAYVVGKLGDDGLVRLFGATR